MGSQLQQESPLRSLLTIPLRCAHGCGQCTIRNSNTWTHGNHAIDSGTFLVENSEIRGRNLDPTLRFRLWEHLGKVKLSIRDCTFVPASVAEPSQAALIGAITLGPAWLRLHLLPCLQRIHIENASQLIDHQSPGRLQGPAIFGNFTPERPTKPTKSYSLTRSPKKSLKKM